MHDEPRLPKCTKVSFAWKLSRELPTEEIGDKATGDDRMARRQFDETIGTRQRQEITRPIRRLGMRAGSAGFIRFD
jgi:hypothetical protein